MLIGADDLAQGGGEYLGIAVLALHLPDHRFKAVDLAGQVPAAGFRAGETQAQLEVLLIAHQHVGRRGDLVEGLPQFLLTALPEGGPVVEVEAHQGAVLLGCPGQLQAAPGGLRAHGGDEAGDVQDRHSLLPEDPGDVKLVDAQGPPHLPGPVVPHPGGPEAEAAVGDVELVAVTPGSALVHLNPLVADVSGAELGLDESGDGAALDKLGQRQALPPQG